MADNRRIWLRLDNTGTPQGFAWGLVASPSEFDPDDPRIPRLRPGVSQDQLLSWGCALTQAQVDAGWSATPTEWRRVPQVARDKQALASAKVEGRELRMHGLAFDLDFRGRPRDAGQEPHEPDARVDDPAAFAALAQSIGMRVSVVERSSRETVIADPEKGISRRSFITTERN